jgi:hypothetical protein
VATSSPVVCNMLTKGHVQITPPSQDRDLPSTHEYPCLKYLLAIELYWRPSGFIVMCSRQYAPSGHVRGAPVGDRGWKQLLRKIGGDKKLEEDMDSIVFSFFFQCPWCKS